MQFLLQRAAEQLEQGLAAQAAGKLEAARRHLLQAADYLFQAAAQTAGPLKAPRLAKAQELLDLAGALPTPQPRRTASPRPKSEPIAAVEGSANAWTVHDRPHVRFDDVAGLDDVKQQIRLKLIYPFLHPELAARYGIRRGGGILLYGPPGTGKTLIARAVAGEVEAAFFSVKPSEIMSKWVGEAEQNIQQLFAAARAYPRSVIFIDEVEALIPRRRESGSTVMQRVVPQILAELEGFDRPAEEQALLFIGATNEPWSLDPAVLRPGRFDEKIYVGLPDLAARLRILELNLHGRPLAADVALAALAERLAGYSGADLANICRKAAAVPFLEAIATGNDRPIALSDFEQVLSLVAPSVAPSEIARYDRFKL